MYLALNKPKGVVTTRHDPEGRTTVMELVPRVAGLFPVGRLDVTTEGLILLTNDGAFAERVAHPRYEVPRVYQAKVRRVPGAETLARLRKGVRVDGRADGGGPGPRAWRRPTTPGWSWSLHEGKHHEVRRLLEAVGHPVSKLRRVALGPVTTAGPGAGRVPAPHASARCAPCATGREAAAGRAGAARHGAPTRARRARR